MIHVSSYACEWAARNINKHARACGLDCSLTRGPTKADLRLIVGWYFMNGKSEAKMKAEVNAAGKSVVWWVGTDILWLEQDPRPDRIAWLNENVAEHWAEWDLSKRRLDALGLKNVRVVHMPTRRLYEPLPLPEKFTVGVYGMDRHPVHMKFAALEAAKLDSSIHWIAYPSAKERVEGNVHHLARIAQDDMEDVYRKMSVHVRLVAADGMPQGPMEAAMCGRPVIYNFCQMPHMIFLNPAKPDKLVAALNKIRDKQARGLAYNWAGADYYRALNDPGRLAREMERAAK